MRLFFTDIGKHIDIEEGLAYIITIENIKLFRDIVTEFLEEAENGNDEKILLSQNGNGIPIAKVASVITDPFLLTVNSKKSLTKLYTYLESVAVNEEMFMQTVDIRAKVNEYIIKLIYKSGLNIEHNTEFGIKGIFTLGNINFSEEGDLVNRLSQYLEICSSFLNLSMVVFVNLSQCCSVQELRELFCEAAYRKINLILLERTEINKIRDEKRLIIDNDMCVVYCDDE